MNTCSECIHVLAAHCHRYAGAGCRVLSSLHAEIRLPRKMVEVERSSFTPLVLSTTAGCGRQSPHSSFNVDWRTCERRNRPFNIVVGADAPQFRSALSIHHVYVDPAFGAQRRGTTCLQM